MAPVSFGPLRGIIYIDADIVHTAARRRTS